MSARRAARTDNNQAEIIAALRNVGASVLDLHNIGVRGVPDVLVAFGGETILLEIKNPKRHYVISDDQKRFRETWTGRCAIVFTVDEALAAIGAQVMGTLQEAH